MANDERRANDQTTGETVIPRMGKTIYGFMACIRGLGTIPFLYLYPCTRKERGRNGRYHTV